MVNLSFLIHKLIGMQAVVDYEFSKGSQNEVIVIELSIAAKNVIHTFHFRNPYEILHTHGSAENRLNWDVGNIPYNQLETALSESVARYAHLYSYRISKCNFLAELIVHSVLNLED